MLVTLVYYIFDHCVVEVDGKIAVAAAAAANDDDNDKTICYVLVTSVYFISLTIMLL